MQLIGKAQRTAHVVQPVLNCPVCGVQVLAGYGVVVAREHLLTNLADLVIHPDVIVGERILRVSRPAQDHSACVVKALSTSDIGMRHHELRGKPVLPNAERVAVGSALDPARLPAPGVIAVGVVIAVTVLVDQSVAVVIDSFRTQPQVLSRLIRFGPRQVIGIVRVFHPAPVGISLAHAGDMPVTIEVISRILVEQSVTVVIDRNLSGARRTARIGLVEMCVT